MATNLTPVNIFTDIPDRLTGELVEVVCKSKNVRIERIVSRGHASPPGFWYDQDTDEYVVLLKGSAGLAIADRENMIEMKPGDSLNIPAGVKHRVEWTDAREDTVWVAVHYR